MKKLICIPTYNEAGNIATIVNAISDLNLGFDIVVIDDNSPDGTGRIVADLVRALSHVHLIQRTGKRGFAASYLDGFRFGLQHHYEYIGEMDADLSHSPEALREVDSLIRSGRYDFIVGSRNIPGGATVNWGWARRLISKGGSLYAKWMLGVPIQDLTGGFNFWSAECLRRINIDTILSDGYVFQIELKTRAFRAGMRFTEFPITFVDRRVGKSKMTKKIVFEAIIRVLLLRFHGRSQ